MIRIAHSLNVLLEQVNAEYPNRGKAWDGAVGDTAHSKRVSDHNPDNTGLVKARDYDITSLSHAEALALADRIRETMQRRFQRGYVIFNRRICNSDVADWAWRAYTGSNPHDHHIHVSVHSLIDTADQWDIVPPITEGIDPMISIDDIKKAAREGVLSATYGRGENQRTVGQILSESRRDAAVARDVAERLAEQAGLDISDIKAKLDVIEDAVTATDDSDDAAAAS